MTAHGFTDYLRKSERLTAALAVLVLAAYFEELDSFETTATDDPGLPYNVRTVMQRVERQKPGKTDPDLRRKLCVWG